MTWKVALPCTLAEAEALAADIGPFALLDSPPVLVTSSAEGEAWRLDAYFEGEPTRADIARLRALVPSAKGRKAKAGRVADADWVALSRSGLDPIRAGRFLVRAAAGSCAPPPGTIALEIDPGRAFGTGRHETTSGCLAALDRLKRDGANFANFADIGTGTGLLAFAALKLWPAARGIASDIDPVAIDVARANAAANAVPLGRGRGRLELAAAAGLDHPRLRARAPFDLILANILAGPLIALAPALAGALAPGGRLILAGLLDRQAGAVLAAFRRAGTMPLARLDRGEWPTLVLRKRRRPSRQPRRLASQT